MTVLSHFYVLLYFLHIFFYLRTDGVTRSRSPRSQNAGHDAVSRNFAAAGDSAVVADGGDDGMLCTYHPANGE